MGPRPVIYGLVAGLVALALALPTGAAAAERTLTIHLAGAGEGWVECEVEGAFPETCEATYPSGTELTLVPEAELESEFAGFSAGTGSATGCGGTAPCSFTLSANSAVTATFVPEALPEFTLTVKKSGSGVGTVECEVEGNTPGPCAAGYPEGTWLRLIETPGTESEFVHWTGACSDYEELEECELTMEGPRSATATFNLWPTLTIHVSGTGSGSVTCEAQEGEEPCAARYPKETVYLHAKADLGSKFAGWSGACKEAGAEEECELTMEGPRSATATFTSQATPEFALTVVLAGEGSGTVSSFPAGIDCGSTCAAKYEKGKEVTLTAEAASGSKFAGWSTLSGSPGACTGTTSPCKVAMSAAVNLKATFDTESGGGGGSGGPSPTSTSVPSPVPMPGIATVAGTAQVKGGKAALRLTCSGGPCAGSVTLTAKLKRGGKTRSVAIGRASFDFAPGASIVLRVKLSPAAAKELERGGWLKAEVVGPGVVSSVTKLNFHQENTGH